MTAFGTPVLPDVNIRYAIASHDCDCCFQDDAGSIFSADTKVWRRQRDVKDLTSLRSGMITRSSLSIPSRMSLSCSAAAVSTISERQLARWSIHCVRATGKLGL